MKRNHPTPLLILIFAGLLLLLNGSRNRVEAAVSADFNFIVNSTGDAGDNNHTNDICATAGGACTLRAAIEQANDVNGTVKITFSFAGSATQYIQPTTPFEVLSNQITIDAQGGVNSDNSQCPTELLTASPKVVLNGVLTASGDGLRITGDNSEIRGLAIINFKDDGIDVSADDVLIRCVFIGTDGGLLSVGNDDHGIEINGDNNKVTHSISSDNANAGVYVCASCSGNDINTTYLGLAIDGSSALGNDIGMDIAGDGNFINGDYPGCNPGFGGFTASGNRIGVRVSGSDNMLTCIMAGYGEDDDVIVPNTDQGLLMTSSAENNTATNGFIVHNLKTGVLFNGGRLNKIAQATIADNGSHGIVIQSSATTSSAINLFGNDIINNDGNGVFVSGSLTSAAIIEGNDIDDNRGDGIRVANGASFIRIIGNTLTGNDGLGIDIGPNGRTPNDGPGDPDSGDNGLQNYPEFQYAFIDGRIDGVIHGIANQTHTIQFYHGSGCLDGETPTGSFSFAEIDVAVGASGSAEFSANIGSTISLNTVATATSIQGTSEFSDCVRRLSLDFEIDTEADDADADISDGLCETAAGDCSFRAALETVNEIGSSNLITLTVDIQGKDDGEGEITINTPLPSLTAPILLESPSGNCSGNSLDPRPMLTLRGDPQLATGSGLQLTTGSGGSHIEALYLLDFPNSGLVVGSDDNYFKCIISGVDFPRAGIAAMHPNGKHGVRVLGNNNDFSLITGSFNGLSGIEVTSAASDNSFTSISTDQNDGEGVLLNAGASDNNFNFLFTDGNGSHGVLVEEGSHDNTFVGLRSGTEASPNAGDGVRIVDSNGTIMNAGIENNFFSENDILYNIGAGIVVSGTAEATTMRYLKMHSNGGLGIDLNGDGVTANAQSSSGANNGQNFPVVDGMSVNMQKFEGDMDGVPDTTYIVDFYRSDSCDASGYGEGAEWLGSAEISTDLIGQGSFSTGLTNDETIVAFDANDAISAVATDPNGNSSEFGPCYQRVTTATSLHAQSVQQPATLANIAPILFVALLFLTITLPNCRVSYPVKL